MMNTSAVLLLVIRAVCFTQDMGELSPGSLAKLAWDSRSMNTRNCLANLFIKIVKIYRHN